MAVKKAKSTKKAAKQTLAPETTPPPPRHYLIEVAVDKKGNFTYKSGKEDARSLRPNLGDTISWEVRVNKKRVPFQIEFPGFGPFGYLNRVIRSGSKATKPMTVQLPKRYEGNLVMDYRVSVPGAWSDDPDIVPPASEGFQPTVAGSSTILLDTDADGRLTLNPEKASFSAGGVVWKWVGDPQDDFVLTFDNQVKGWPKGPTASVNGVIELSLKDPGANQPYTIVTEHSNLQAKGALTITA